MVTILEYKYSSKSEHIKETKTRIAEFESFKEYLKRIQKIIVYKK